MKKILVFLSIVGLPLIAKAQNYKTSTMAPAAFEKVMNLNLGEGFEIDNFRGLTEVFEIQGDKLQVEAFVENGEGKAEVRYYQLDNGNRRIFVKYADATTSTPGKQNSTSQVAIAKGPGSAAVNASPGSTVSINIGGADGPSQVIIQGGGKVTVNGVEIDTNQSENMESTERPTEVRLRVGIPAKVLRDLKVNSLTGDITVKGQFHNNFEKARSIRLESSQGDISCQSICGRGDLKAKTVEGLISLKNVTGPTKLETVSGEIFVKKGMGPLTVESVIGAINVDNHLFGKVNAWAISGDIIISNSGYGVEVEAKSMTGQTKIADIGTVYMKHFPMGPEPNFERFNPSNSIFRTCREVFNR